MPVLPGEEICAETFERIAENRSVRAEQVHRDQRGCAHDREQKYAAQHRTQRATKHRKHQEGKKRERPGDPRSFEERQEGEQSIAIAASPLLRKRTQAAAA